METFLFIALVAWAIWYSATDKERTAVRHFKQQRKREIKARESLGNELYEKIEAERADERKKNQDWYNSLSDLDKHKIVMGYSIDD